MSDNQILFARIFCRITDNHLFAYRNWRLELKFFEIENFRNHKLINT